jgi:hypothetical protein
MKHLFSLFLPLALLASASAQIPQSPGNPPVTRLYYGTNAHSRISFHSYMACRRPPDSEFGHGHFRVGPGDTIVFENGACLEIGETSFSYNGETTDYTKSNYVIGPTNIHPGYFINFEIPCREASQHADHPLPPQEQPLPKGHP